MPKDLEISRLCDAYGALLTENMLRTVRAYYDYDLSLAEIAEECGITRQAVLCRLRQAEGKLRELERAVGLVRKSDELLDKINAARRALETDAERGRSLLDGIITELSER